jgi:flagellar protein FlaJ
MSGTNRQGTESDAVVLSEYEVSQYFPQEPEFSEEERRRLREEYGFVRAYFKMRPDEHRGLQRWLNQARMGTTYDIYLERSAYYAGGAAVIGFLLSVVLALLLGRAGILAGLRSPIRFQEGVAYAIATYLSANRVLLASVLISVVGGVVIAASAWYLQYYYPRLRADTRERNIDFMLPNAIVFMYALTYGGMSLVEVMDKLAEADDAYGAVSEEFDMIRRDVDLFGNDLYTAIRNARNLTPSDNLEQFLDDMVSVLESGGEVSDFLEESGKTYLRRAQESQEDFLETLAILSEVFIVGFVAAPLFLVVILLVISVLGGQSLQMLYVIIYAGLPLGMALFLVLVSTLSDPYVYPSTTLVTEDEEPTVSEELAENPDFVAYRKTKRWLAVRHFLDDPLRVIKQKPLLSLAFTVPAALVVVGLLALAGRVTPSTAALLERPLTTTTFLFVVPFFVVAVPLSFFHELKRGREDEISRRFPDVLNILSSANNMGIPLVDAFDIVSRWTGGRFAEDLRTVRNDIRWNDDIGGALLSFANRLDVPQVSRTVKLIAEGGRSTGDLSRVLSVAAEDTRNRYRIARDRRRSMSSYIAVVVIGYLVYLMVIVLLDANFLTPISNLADQSTSATPGAPGVPTGLSNIPVDTYRMLFYHSTIIQGIGSGLLAGQLADNDILGGLKYSLLLVTIATFAFQFI